MKVTSSPWVFPAALMLVSVAVVLTLYWPTAESIGRVWATSTTYSYGMLIVPVSLFLAWTRRARLRTLTPRPAFWALPLLAGLASLWLLGKLSSTDVIQHFSLVVMVIATIWGIIGTAGARAMLLPLSFLLFAVPVGAGLIPTLQLISAGFAANALDLFGVPVLLEGLHITVPFGKWHVAEACSGIRTLVACVVTGYLYAGVTYRSWSRRLIFVAASAIVPIFANALRIVGIILVGYLLGSTESAAMHHTLTGSVFTGLIMLLMLLLGRLWREEPATPPATPLPSLHTDDPRMLRAAMPGTPQYAKSSVVFAILAATSVSIAPLYAQVAWRQTVDAGLPKLAAPALAAPWLAGTSGTRNWLPHVVAPSSEMMQTYLAGNREVTLYIAYFPASQADVKLVSSENALYDSSHWLQISNGFDVATCDGRSFRVRDMILRSAGSSLRMWYWYWIDGTCTGDERMAKFLLAKARLFGSPQGSAIVAVAGSNLDGSPADTATLRHVISGIPIDLLLRVN